MAPLRLKLSLDDGELLGELFGSNALPNPPTIRIIPSAKGKALGEGDRILAHISPSQIYKSEYEARFIHKFRQPDRTIFGVFRTRGTGGQILSVEKGRSRPHLVQPGGNGAARNGDLVKAKESGFSPIVGRTYAKVVERFGNPFSAGALSMISIKASGIRDKFPNGVLREAEFPCPDDATERADLRDIPFVTIDPENARDYDDAVFATEDVDPSNCEGHVIWVAIADVARYVWPGSRLDSEARLRGNSTYFPDRVVHMLPERLSQGLCSLKPDEDRPAVVLRVSIDARGNRVSHQFMRGVVRSAEALNYKQVQAALDGDRNAMDTALFGKTVKPLYQAFKTLLRTCADRQPLRLGLRDHRVVLSDSGNIESISEVEPLDSHRLIEEFMILANVCAADTLGNSRTPALYRNHGGPSSRDIIEFNRAVKSLGSNLGALSKISTRRLNALIGEAAKRNIDEPVEKLILSILGRAEYNPVNGGHFALNLRRYTHFTSPIRRYSDILIHRSLISILGLGSGGLGDSDIRNLKDTSKHINETERRSMRAERDTFDRFAALFLLDRIGDEFLARITGIARFGIFVKLVGFGAEGLIPRSRLPNGAKPHLGLQIDVRLTEVAPESGGLTFELVETSQLCARTKTA